jgi:hypothetical protein
MSRGLHEETDAENLRAAGGIASFLWLWDPKQFEAFFDIDKLDRFELSCTSPGLTRI